MVKKNHINAPFLWWRRIVVGVCGGGACGTILVGSKKYFWENVPGLLFTIAILYIVGLFVSL